MTKSIITILGIMAVGGSLLAWTTNPERVAAQLSIFDSLQLAPDPDNGECLTTDGTDNVWSTSCGGSSGATTLDGLNDVTITSSSTGNILYLAGSGQWVNLATGSDGQVLKLASGIPSWDTDNTAAGGSGLGSTTPWTAGQLAVVATDGALKSVATSTLSENISGLEFDANPWIVGSARTLSLSSGYVIPLSASTTEWSLAYASTTALTPSYIRGLFSNTATGLTYNSSTGETSLTAGYNIPLVASTTEWHNKVSSQWGTSGSNIYYSAGNVGIGTTSPSEKLHVVTSGYLGGITLSGSNTIGTSLLLDSTATGGRDYALFSTANGSSAGGGLFSIYDQTATQHRLVVNSTGNVGIGTTTPTSALTVQTTSGAATSLLLANTSTGTTGYTQMGFQGTGRRYQLGVGNAGETTYGVADKFYLFDSTGGAMRMVVDTSGNVGIGTTTPTGKLDVEVNSGTSPSIVNIRTTGTTASASYSYLRFDESASANKYAQLVHFNSNYVTASLQNALRLQVNNSGPMLFNVGSDGTTEAMRITGAGNVGIGTTGPGNKLSVVSADAYPVSIANFEGSDANAAISLKGTAAGAKHWKLIFGGTGSSAPGGLRFFDATSVVDRMTIDTTGNVGIGTAGPEAKTHIQIADAGTDSVSFSAANDALVLEGNNDVYLHLFSPAAYGSAIKFGDVDALSRGMIYYNQPGDYMRFDTAGSERFRITSAGNVGIGTTTPATALSVVGTSTTNALRISGLSNTLLGVDASGNVVATTTSGAGTVTSVAATVPTGFTLTGSPITSSGTLAFGYTTGYSLLATTTLGSLIDGATAKTTPADNDMFGLMDSAASNVLKKFSWANLIDAIEAATLTVTGSWNLNGATIKQHTYKSFTWPGVATTTAATTTIPLGTAYTAEAWNGADCWVTSGSGAFIFTDGTNRMNGATATTTVSRTTLSTNNTFTAQERRYVEIGPLTNAMITCSVDVTINN